MSTLPGRPRAVVLDVNETLSDASALLRRVEQVGAAGAVGDGWLSLVLRDGFAATVVGAPRPFADVLADVLRGALGAPRVRAGLDRDLDAAVEFVLGSFGEFTLHPDVAAGVRRLRSAGVLVAALTNGSLATCEDLLERGGVRDAFSHVLSVEDVGPWKPHPAAYGHAVDALSVDPGDVLLAAVHPWDVDGAARAGLRTAWIDRTGTPHPRGFRAPDVTVGGVDALADAVLGPA